MYDASPPNHLVFSTKDREPWLLDSVRDDLHAYIGGTISNHDGVLLKAGSVLDHIHLLASHPRTMAPSEFVKEIKIASSKWLKQSFQSAYNYLRLPQ